MHAGGASASLDDASQSGVLPWLSILGACLCFGTFAVPMKTTTVVDAKVHPLVFQGYKTFWVFVTTHLVLLFQPYEFTWWGILSGFSWVPAGVASVYAVQNAGIARAQAIWQVTLILASFFWGFAVVRDSHVHNAFATAFFLVCLVAGVVGMTSAFNLRTESLPAFSGPVPYMPVKTELEGVALPARFDSTRKFERNEPKSPWQTIAFSSRSVVNTESSTRATYTSTAAAAPCGIDSAEDGVAKPGGSTAWGMVAAVFNGIWGSANLVPSHFAPYGGIHFAISFATGALIANIVLVIAYTLLLKAPIPSPKFRVMAMPGFLSGALWSAGNFCSLYAVSTVGQGIGYSLIQSSVIVSGLWGIFYYRELSGQAVRHWFLACALCMLGIFGLASEKE